MSARSSTTGPVRSRRTPTTPVPAMPSTTSHAVLAQPGRDDPRRPVLGEGQLGVGVQVGVDRLEPGRQRRPVGGGAVRAVSGCGQRWAPVRCACSLGTLPPRRGPAVRAREARSGVLCRAAATVSPRTVGSAPRRGRAGQVATPTAPGRAGGTPRRPLPARGVPAAGDTPTYEVRRARLAAGPPTRSAPRTRAAAGRALTARAGPPPSSGRSGRQRCGRRRRPRSAGRRR